MQKLVNVSLLILLALSASTIRAQGRGAGPSLGGNIATAPRSQGSTRSNAPSGTPAASADRDTGRDRAEDVGKGKKKGLDKNPAQKKNKSQAANAGTR